MNEINEMMTMWKEMDCKLSSLIDENRRLAEEVKKNKLQSSREKLIRKYRAFIIMEAVCIPLMYLVFGVNPLVDERYRWATVIYFVCFLLLEICIDGYLLYKLNYMDIYNYPVSEITRMARTNWKIHKIAVIVGIPIALGALVLVCLALGGFKETLIGICIGLAIGIGIGLNEFFKFMKNYKTMISSE